MGKPSVCREQFYKRSSNTAKQRMPKQRPQQLEFIVLMASLMCISPMAVDTVLPALESMGAAVHTSQATDYQLLITMVILGLGIGSLFFGPISDSIGRKPAIFMGFFIFLIGIFICIRAEDMTVMVLGRILQGIGLSAPRTIAIAIIRDKHAGDYMARTMSFICVFLILIPIIFPILGKTMLDLYHWQAIFYTQMVLGILVCLWFWKRQAETLVPSKRIQFTRRLFVDGIKEIIGHKDTIGYTVISGLMTGAFIAYLSTAQQIFEQQYQLKDEFPYIFSLLLIPIGSAAFLTGLLVLQYGMKKLITIALSTYFAVSLLYSLLFYHTQNPDVMVLSVFFMFQFFTYGLLYGNLKTMALQPIGHIAGIGSAIIGCISTLMSVAISILIGKFVIDTTWPLFIGFAICSILSLLIQLYLRISARTLRVHTIISKKKVCKRS